MKTSCFTEHFVVLLHVYVEITILPGVPIQFREGLDNTKETSHRKPNHEDIFVLRLKKIKFNSSSDKN
jgi:hypothetical protein